jgi:hypothetical protein
MFTFGGFEFFFRHNQQLLEIVMELSDQGGGIREEPQSVGVGDIQLSRESSSRKKLR